MNPAIARLEPSLIRELHTRRQPGDIDLGLGEPVLPPDPEPLIKAVEWVARHGCRYTHNLGDPVLREAVGAYIGRSSESVCITNGSQEALYLALRAALDPSADEVLIVEPAYPAYSKICQMEGIPYRTVSLSADSGFAPSAATVLAALKPQTRMVLLASPCNPTARTWPRTELEALTAGLEGRWLLMDEVYRELYYTGHAPTAVQSMYSNTIVVGGLSKCAALTGLRIGWISTPPQLGPLVMRVHQLVLTAASTLSQQVALAVLQMPGLVGRHRPIYQERRRAMLGILKRLGLHYVPPDGAFYTMVQLPPTAPRSLDTALQLLEVERVVTVPGGAFGAASEGWLRISWAGNPFDVRTGLERLARFCHFLEVRSELSES